MNTLNKNQNLDVNPVYNREIDNPFVDCDVHDVGHSTYYEEAMLHLETIFIPSFMDWHYAEFLRKFLLKHNFAVYFQWPFCTGTYENAYARYITMFGLEEECQWEWYEECERVRREHSDLMDPVEEPF